MRPKLLLLTAIALLTAAALWFDYSAQYAGTSSHGKPFTVPQFDVTAVDTNQAYGMSDFKGKTVLINFWATWCVPCRVEFPELIALAERHPDTLVLLLLSVDQKPQDALRFARHNGKKAGYPAGKKLYEGRGNIIVAWDENKRIATTLFGTYKFPESYIINPDQTIRRKWVGPATKGKIEQLELELTRKAAD